MKNQSLISKIIQKSLCAFLILPLASCGSFNYTKPDSPKPLTTLTPLQPKPKVALVLGSGGPRGYAHIGVMKVLEKAGIDYDLVVGSSVGALLGAFWAHGYSAEKIDALSKEGGPLTIFDISLFADRGWIHGQRLQDYVNDQLHSNAIEKMPKKFVAVATQIENKQPVFFNSGNVGVAVRASSAVSGVFSPVGINGVEYEDGDESLPVAVRAAKQAGATFIIAVDVSALLGSAPADAKPASLEREARRRSRIDPELLLADFVIRPDMGYFASPSTAFFDKARLSGETAALALLPSLRAALKTKGLE